MKIFQLILKHSMDEKHEKVKTKTIAASEKIDEKASGEINSHIEEYLKGLTGQLQLFSFYKLEAGGYCLCRLRDIPGKESEWFSHSLILTEGYLPFYPVEMYDSAEFKDTLTEDEMDRTEIIKLPVLRNIAQGTVINFETVSGFIKNIKGYSLRHMLSSVMDFEEEEAGIILRDKRENIPCWVGAVQMSFPRETAHSISFVIRTEGTVCPDYVINAYPENAELLNSIPGRSFIFDFVTGVFKKSRNEYRFTRLVDLGYSVSRDTLSAFHSFLERFDYKKSDSGIEDCYRLFNLVNFGIGQMNKEDIEAALSFANDYGAPGLLEDIFDMMVPVLDKMSLEVNLDTAGSITEFLFAIAENSKKTLYKDLCYDFLFNCLDHIINKNEDLDEDKLFGLYNDIKGKYEKNIEKYHLSPKRLRYLKINIEEGTFTSRSQIYLNMVIEDVISSKLSWNRAAYIEGFTDFIDAASGAVLLNKGGYVQVLNASAEDVDVFAHVTALFYNKLILDEDKAAFSDIFADVLENRGPEWAMEARDAVNEIKTCHPLLVEELIMALKYTENKVELFWNSYKYDRKETMTFLILYSAPIFRAYVEQLKDEKFDSECVKLISYIIDFEIDVEAPVAASIIRGFENTLQLSKPEEKQYELIGRIKKYKNDRRIHTSPDIIELITFCMWLEGIQGNWRIKMGEVLEEKLDITRLDEVKYMDFLRWCLPMLLYFAVSAEDHKLVIESFWRNSAKEGFLKEYVSALKLRLEKKSSRDLDCTVGFLFHYFYFFCPKLANENEDLLIQELNSNIIDMLSGTTASFIRELDYYLKREFGEKGLSLPITWTEVYNEILKRQNKPLFKKIANIFKR